MKVISIIPYKILPAQLGGEKGIAIFNNYLSREVELVGITTANNNPALASGYRLLNILSNSRLRYINFFLYFTIRNIIRRENAGFLLIEHPYYGWLAWLLRKTLKIRLVVHSHNIEYMRSKSIGRSWWKLLKWYEGWVYTFADKVFFISEDDREFAIREMKLNKEKSIAVTYGIEQAVIPTDRDLCRQIVSKKHQIEADECILLFNGALYHSTNYEALQIILDNINPVLLRKTNFKYKILVCGKGLPHWFEDLRLYADKNIIYAGFVDDISIYFKAADIFLNPILNGGGVKTKAIEALALNCTVISSKLGAMGIVREVCGNKLIVVEQEDWNEFAEEIIGVSRRLADTPPIFYDYYYWPNIVRRAVSWISN